MPLPTRSKTWEFDVNIVGATSSGSDETDCDETMLAMKNALINGTAFTMPWTVVSSSDGVTADNTDRWLDIGDLVHEAPGVAHSWIVLQAPVGDLQICIETEFASSLPERWNIFWSPTVGFTGGTVTNRPTAADEEEVTPNTNIFPSATFTSKVHCMMSSDGTQTRLFVMVGGVCLLALFTAELADPPAGLTDPSFIHFAGIGSGEMLDFNDIWSNTRARINNGGSVIARYSCEAVQTGTSTVSFEAFPGFPVANGISAEFHIGPVGVWGPEGTPHAGKLGNLPDVWWGHEVVNTGDQYPPSGTLYQFVQFGDLIFPWDSTTVAQTS